MGLRRTAITVGVASLGFLACVPAPAARDDTAVRREVGAYADTIVLDLRRDGPRAWLRHFKRTPAFFMASDGQLEFPDNDFADVFMEDLAGRVISMDRQWGELRVDPLTSTLAVFATPFHEVVTNPTGTALRFDGYLTAVAKRDSSGWKLRNAHWSLATGND